MATCISCKKESEIHFRALEVHTLPVRDLGGEKKVQALGEFKDFDVCRECALKKQEDVMNYKKAAGRKLAVYAGIVLVGGVLLAVIFAGLLNRVFMTMWIACVLGGVLMAAGTLQSGRDKKAE